jgi:hypothetical protein
MKVAVDGFGSIPLPISVLLEPSAPGVRAGTRALAVRWMTLRQDLRRNLNPTIIGQLR